jgi:hypothetical protein
MNNTTDIDYNSTVEEYYYPLEYWLNAFGYLPFADMMYFFFQPIVSFLGLLMNSWAMGIMLNRKFKDKKMFSYLRVYLANSAILSFVCMFSFTTTMRYVNFNMQLSMIYLTYIYVVFYNTGYFLGSLLDIQMICNQICMIKNKEIKLLEIFSPYTRSLIALVFCICVNSPYYFVFSPQSDSVKLGANETRVFHFYGHTEFADSLAGKIVNFTLFFGRDLVTLVFEISLNVWLIFLVKKHQAKKSILLNRGLPSQSSSLNIAERQITRHDLRVTLMVMLMSLLSTLAHLFEFSGLVYNLIYTDELTIILPSFADLFISIKHSSNFIILILFNSKFRSSVLYYFNFFASR